MADGKKVQGMELGQEQERNSTQSARFVVIRDGHGRRGEQADLQCETLINQLSPHSNRKSSMVYECQWPALLKHRRNVGT